jgi:hypothetical protein
MTCRALQSHCRDGSDEPSLGGDMIHVTRRPSILSLGLPQEPEGAQAAGLAQSIGAKKWQLRSISNQMKTAR